MASDGQVQAKTRPETGVRYWLSARITYGPFRTAYEAAAAETDIWSQAPHAQTWVLRTTCECTGANPCAHAEPVLGELYKADGEDDPCDS